MSDEVTAKMLKDALDDLEGWYDECLGRDRSYSPHGEREALAALREIVAAGGAVSPPRSDAAIEAMLDVLREEVEFPSALVANYVYDGMSDTARRAGLAALKAADEEVPQRNRALVRRAILAADEVDARRVSDYTEEPAAPKIERTER